VKEFWEQLKIIFFYMRLEDKYWGLFFIGLLVLFYLRTRETKRLLVLASVISLVCICPLTAYILMEVFPLVSDYHLLWHVVPASVVVCAALSLILERLWDNKVQRWGFVVGIFLIFFFAGEFAYTSADAWNDDVTHLGREEVLAYDLILTDMKSRDRESASLWGPYKLMADSRIYDGELRPIYGKDIINADALYSETQRSLFEGYTRYASTDADPADKEEQVAAIAGCLDVYSDVDCDYVVMIAPSAQDADVDVISIFEGLGYVYVGQTGTYQIFRRV